jgi:hypothetical protein
LGEISSTSPEVDGLFRTIAPLPKSMEQRWKGVMESVMRRTIPARFLPTALLLTVIVAPSAFAQAPTGDSPPTRNKRAECRSKAAEQYLPAAALRHYVQICVQEARLNCLEQANAGNVRGGARKQFIKRCMG